MTKLMLQAAALLMPALCILFPKPATSQNAFEKALMTEADSFLVQAPVVVTRYELSPNDAMQSLMSPSGWGGYGTYIFGGIGGAYPEVYKSTKPDLIASAGACVGNPVKAVNFAASLNMTNVHKFKDFSENFVLSKSIFKGSSIAVGGLQLFAKRKQSDAPGPTFFVAFSHAVQTVLSKTQGCSGLSYTIGIGTGRFIDKSPKDIAAGRGKHGTAVFGDISYEIFKHVNASAEWSGMNLGFSLGMRPFKNALSIGIGVANLTRYSSDKANMVFSIGYPLALNR